MKLLQFFAILLGTMFMVSCTRDLGQSDLRPRIQPNENLLPVLEAKAITSVYPKSKKKPYGRDAESIFISEVNDNIIEQTGPKKGYITMRIVSEDTRPEKLYSVIGALSIIPMGIPVILGSPCAAYTQDLEVEVKIQNNNKDVVKRYLASSKNTEYVANWWGYRARDAVRKIAADNLKAALSDIRRQINHDAAQLRAALK